jgi:hypothetical protein
VHVFGEFVVVERLRRGDRVAEDLQFAVGEGRQEIVEQVDPFGRRFRLVFLDEIHDAGELHCRDRSHRSTLTMPLAASPSCILIAAACSPAKPPPSIISSRSGAYEGHFRISHLVGAAYADRLIFSKISSTHLSSIATRR